MSWIEEKHEDDAEGELAAIYADIAERRGRAANILKAQSLNPGALKAHLEFYMSVMFAASPLTREERELIAVIVSATNRCGYCTLHHRAALQHYWKDHEVVDEVIRDFRAAGLPPKWTAMLEYAEKLTRAPHLMEPADVFALREAGFDDRAVLDIALVVGYFNFVNRLATGLGVEPAPGEIEGYEY